MKQLNFLISLLLLFGSLLAQNLNSLIYKAVINGTLKLSKVIFTN